MLGRIHHCNYTLGIGQAPTWFGFRDLVATTRKRSRFRGKWTSAGEGKANNNETTQHSPNAKTDQSGAFREARYAWLQLSIRLTVMGSWVMGRELGRSRRTMPNRTWPSTHHGRVANKSMVLRSAVMEMSRIRSGTR